MKLIAGKEAEYAEYVTKNQDSYGKGVVDYGEAWAKLLEARIPDCTPSPAVMRVIVDHAKADSHEANTEGITGFMYGCAVQALAHFWIHGEELRRWHNLETQIRDEGAKANESGGVLNPALLNIETQGE